MMSIKGPALSLSQPPYCACLPATQLRLLASSVIELSGSSPSPVTAATNVDGSCVSHEALPVGCGGEGSQPLTFQQK